MQDLQNIVKEVLKQDDRFLTSNGDLLKNIIRTESEKLDENLIILLLENTKTREVFFKPIKDIVVFDSKKFIQFLNNKEFLANSYTSFKNKIGLVNNKGDFISDSNEVVLSFPYKDGILAGGQDKEDVKRNEVFYNEILGSDDIDRLLDEKVFTNFKRIDKDGEHKIDGFNRDEEGTIKDNLIIKGNNLLALHSLKSNFVGKIKLIYIDPPYNTGNDSFGYNDKFNHSTWLTFMKNRLQIAKKLLSDDGVIFVQCDDNEQAYLKVLMDEVFGINNFINCIAIKMSEATGVKMSHASKRFPNIKEYILFYKKSSNFKGFYEIDKYKNNEWDKENNIYLENFTQEKRKNIINISNKKIILDDDVKKVISILSEVKRISLSKKLKTLPSNIDKTNWLFENSYRIIKTAGSSSLAKQVLKLEIIPNQEISAFTSRDGILFFYITDFNRETRDPRLRVIFADENIYKNPCDFWQDIKTSGAISNERGVQLPGGKKPEKILHRIIKMITKEGDIILDFHAGSGTTAGVAHKMKRQWITIEQIQEQLNLSIKGLKNVINGDNTGISNLVDWKCGGEFVYMEIAKSNQIFLDMIKKAKISKELVKVYEEIKESGFINYYVDIEKIDENIKEFEKLSLDNQKVFLIELLDKNMLYVNYSEIEDSSYGISEEDMEINRKFYKK